MVNRYQGNSGRVERFPEPPRRPPAQSPAPPRPDRPPEPPRKEPPAQHPNDPHRPPMQKPPPRQNAGGGMSGTVQRLMQRISPSNLEQEDIILLLILYLLYRESGDREFLITLGAFLFL